MVRSILESVPSTSLIFCSGMMRSGSTWSFNVCRLLAQVAARQHNLPFWSGYLTLEQCEQFLAHASRKFPGPTVVKAHGLGPIALRYLALGQATAICTFRDPRSCVASLMQFSNVSFAVACGRILEGLRMLDQYPRQHTLFVRYEQIVNEPLTQIREIGAHL